MIETTLSQLRQLKLTGMASALQTQMDQPGTYEGLAFAERLQLLVDHEDQERNTLPIGGIPESILLLKCS